VIAEAADQFSDIHPGPEPIGNHASQAIRGFIAANRVFPPQIQKVDPQQSDLMPVGMSPVQHTAHGCAKGNLIGQASDGIELQSKIL
jgi:hypothetical protein